MTKKKKWTTCLANLKKAVEDIQEAVTETVINNPENGYKLNEVLTDLFLYGTPVSGRIAPFRVLQFAKRPSFVAHRGDIPLRVGVSTPSNKQVDESHNHDAVCRERKRNGRVRTYW